MKKYKVHLCEETCGDVIVEADNETDAELAAMQSAVVEWSSDAETHVTLVEEVDDDTEVSS
jgi:hypothetical protein